MLPVRKIACLVGSVVFVATAATALAATRTYCVTTPAAPPGCSGTSESTLTDALTAADADTTGSDQIVLPAGTQTEINPYVYTGGVPLEIDGQGKSSVVTLIGGISNAAVFSDAGLLGGITLHSLEVAIPSGSSGTADGIHLYKSTGETVSNVTVVDNANTGDAGIILNNGGTVSGSNVQMGTVAGPADTALSIPGGTATVTDSTLIGDSGVVVESGAVASIARSTLWGDHSEALAVVDSSASIADSYLNSINNQALHAIAVSHASTIIGSFLTIGWNASEIGVSATVQGNFNANVYLNDSIVTDPVVNSIYTHRSSGTGVPTVTTTSSDYDPTTIATYNGAPYVPGAHDVTAYIDPKFASDSDSHLLASSPLLNYDNRALGFLDSPNDLAGFPRPANGPQDLGAYQHPPNPTVSASATVPSHSTLYPGTVLAFTASGSEPYPNDGLLTYSWKFDDGSTASTQNVSHAFSTAGKHTATVTATDRYGFAASASTTVTVTPTPPGPPVIAHLTESHKTFRTSGKRASATAKHRRAPVGTVFSFTLDQTATVDLTFSPGRGHGFAHALMIHGHPGTDHVAFFGTVQGRRLKPRKYTLIVKAFNAYGKASKPLTLTFTIVR